MPAPNLLLVSSSRFRDLPAFAHAEAEIKAHFQGVPEICFIPYADPGGAGQAAYTEKIKTQFAAMGLSIRGLNEALDPKVALAQTQGIFTGGGNTFLLLKTLYELDLIEPLRAAIARGVPYMGSSAGSNLAGLTIGTTNDMPIVYPPSFDALGAIPMNLNPHYPWSEDEHHRGESRDERILEFCHVNPQPVLALRENGWLRVQGKQMWVEGGAPARLFRQGHDPKEVPAGTELSTWL